MDDMINEVAEVTSERIDDVITIKVDGNFKFGSHRQFRDAYSPYLNTDGLTFRLDFSKVKFIDSSALGLMLLLRSEFEQTTSKIKIINVPTEIKKILDIAQFPKLFKIE